MKVLSFGSAGHGDAGFQRWVTECLRAIEQASVDDLEQVLRQYSTTGAFTPTRTFDASTADATVLRNVIATILSDIKKGGQKKSYGS
jgi:hypothetical protein